MPKIVLALVTAATPLWAQPGGPVQPAGPVESARKPNIIVILADDLGYADLGVQGNTDIPTPHIDSIAEEGVRFTDGYATHPYCSPSRAGLLTGMYQHRFGFEQNSGQEEYTSKEFGIPRDVPILAETLKTAGYRTAWVGKWHVGFEKGLRPHERGFDYAYGFLAGAMNYNPVARSDDNRRDPRIPAQCCKKIFRNGKEVKHERYLTDVFGEEAAAFIKGTPRTTPFFVYLAFNAVHGPMEATPAHEAPFKSIADSKRRTYAGMTKAMDDAIGRVLQTLREEGIEEDTLIFFYSDNGGPTWQTTSRNDPLRGGKAQTFEGGIRIPFMIQWKGRLPRGEVRHDMVMGFDVHATGASRRGNRFLDPLEAARWSESACLICWVRATKPRIRSCSGATPRTMPPGSASTSLSVSRATSNQLFDLDADIGEARDLAASHPEVLKRVQAAYAHWSSQMMAPRWVKQTQSNAEIGGRLKKSN